VSSLPMPARLTRHPGPPPASGERLRRGDILLFAAAWALASGVAVAGVQTFRRLVLGRLVFNSDQIVWMAPAAQLLVLGVLGVVLWLVDRPRARRWRPAALVLLGFFGTFAVLLLFGGLARWAGALLALGVGFQVQRTFAANPARWRGRVRAGSLALASLVVLVSVGRAAAGRLERAAIRRGLPAAPAGVPNVLLIILDTVRRDHLSLYGYGRPTTPALERWATNSAVFDQAFSTAPWTLPSHGSLFTGQLGSRLGGDWKIPIQGAPLTLAEVLRRQGYETGGFAANLLYVTRETRLTRGLTDFSDYPLTFRQVCLHSPLVQVGLVKDLLEARSAGALVEAVRDFNLNLDMIPASEYRSAGDITDGFLAWQATKSGRPFLAILNYFDAHAPPRAPDDLLERFGTENKGYDAAIAYMDRELDRLFTELAHRGVLNQTLVIVTADHGELFGEHGLTGHANGLYLPLIRAPLLFRYPGHVSPGRVAGLASLRDIPRTVLDLIGLAAPAEFGAGSLAGLLGKPDAAAPSPVVAELSQGVRVNPKFRNAETWLQSLTDPEYHYIRDGKGNEELFRWAADSLEEVDLAPGAEGEALLPRYRARLDSLVGRPE
jgi:arylsulfatase A-like enzyme